MLESPVISSTCSVTLTPSMKSSNLRNPDTSATTGWVCGSQVATTWPAFTRSPSLAEMVAPYGSL